ncbi:MAG: TonB family protein [Candidatus Omnitrophota bacterium]|nr:TonB family protein [Candidatus Omnitrophota bacterium]
MTKKRLIRVLLISLFSGYLVFGVALSGYQLASGGSLDSRIEESIDIVVGEIQSVTVYSPTRISLADPKIADIVKIEAGKELILTGKTPGSTTLNIWDKYGQRSMLVRVASEDLERLKARLEELLTNIDINNLSIGINKEEGKIILSGDILTSDKDKFKGIVEPFGNKIINFVNINEETALVQIDVQILELSKSAADKLGIQWISALTFTETAASAARNLTNLVGLFKDKDNWTRNTFAETINMLITEGKGRVLSRPKLVCLSGKEASFLVGGQIPIITSTTTSGGNTSTNVEFKDYGVNLKVKPTVKKGDRIDITINTEISSVDKGNAVTSGGSIYYAYSTRSASTQLYMHDGETVFMAGLIKNDEADTVSRVPAISKVPILGALFKSKDFSNNQTELVITLTPSIIKSGGKKEELKLTVDKPILTADKSTSRINTAEISAEDKPVAILKELPEYLVEYARKIQEKISQATKYPEEARQLGWEGTVRLHLRLLSDGTISDIKVKQSSGYEIFDDSAIAAAKKQSPYPIFPAELRAREISLDVPVVYNLNPNS